MAHKYIIVDDEYLTRMGTIKKLEPISHMLELVGEAENGQEALSLIEAQQPAIIITDMYMPVMDGSELLKHISSTYPHIQIIVISGYRSFEYAQDSIHSKAITYLVKPFSREDIQNAVIQAIEVIESRANQQNTLSSITEERERVSYEYDVQTIKSLILGLNLREVEFTSKAMQEIAEDSCYSLLTLTNADLDIRSLQDLCQAHLPIKSFVICDHYFESHILFIVLFFRNMQEATKLHASCAAALNAALASVGICGCIGLSTPQVDIIKIENAFNNCITAMDSKPLRAHGGVFVYADNMLTYRNIVWEQEETFIFQLDSGNLEKATNMFSHLYHSICESPKVYTVMEYKYYILNLTNALKFDSVNQPITVSADISDDLRRQFRFLFDADDLARCTENIFRLICQRRIANPIYIGENVVENMQIYVQRNYAKDISLEFVSSLFYLNRSYASTLFKSKTGLNFIDYVSKIRIEKAQKLLAGDMRLSQIAASVGYGNVKYFFRVFKKFTGLTPEQYRLQSCSK